MVITDEHENSLQKEKEQHLQQLEEVKRAKETSLLVPMWFSLVQYYDMLANK